MRTTTVIKALDGVTATTTSNVHYVGNADRVGILFKRANHSSGSSAFTVKGFLGDAENTPASAAMVAYNLLIDNVTNTNAQTLTRVAGKTLSADGYALVWCDPACLPTHLEITVTETTDGTHSAWIILQTDC